MTAKLAPLALALLACAPSGVSGSVLGQELELTRAMFSFDYNNYGCEDGRDGPPALSLWLVESSQECVGRPFGQRVEPLRIELQLDDLERPSSDQVVGGRVSLAPASGFTGADATIGVSEWRLPEVEAIDWETRPIAVEAVLSGYIEIEIEDDGGRLSGTFETSEHCDARTFVYCED